MARKLMKEKGAGGRELVPTISFGRLDESYNKYLEEIDPAKPDVQLALAQSTDIRFREFFERLGSPRYRHYKLATIAKSCDISLAQFAEFWQKAQHSLAVAKAQNAIVGLTDDMALDARSRKINCERCDGFGWVYVEGGVLEKTQGLRPMGDRMIRTCPGCGGEGRIAKTGDLDSRKLLLEMAGHTGKRGGAAVQITQHFGGMSMESAVGKMAGVSFDLSDEDYQVHGESGTFDGRVAEDAEPPASRRNG